jgi:formate hydrogenlyase subunit 3/multisubunit Na+/H+ antiporter MnhD subunit
MHEKMIIESFLPLLVILIPVVTALGLMLVNEREGLKLTAAGNLASFLVSLLMVSGIWHGNTFEYILDTGFYNINLAFFADSLSLLIGLAANFVWVIASFYSIEYMSHSKKLR